MWVQAWWMPCPPTCTPPHTHTCELLATLVTHTSLQVFQLHQYLLIVSQGLLALVPESRDQASATGPDRRLA